MISWLFIFEKSESARKICPSFSFDSSDRLGAIISRSRTKDADTSSYSMSVKFILWHLKFKIIFKNNYQISKPIDSHVNDLHVNEILNALNIFISLMSLRRKILIFYHLEIKIDFGGVGQFKNKNFEPSTSRDFNLVVNRKFVKLASLDERKNRLV